MLVSLATASSLVMALALLGCGAPGPIQSDLGSIGRPVVPTPGMPAGHPQNQQLPRIEPAECVTQELVDAEAGRGSSNRRMRNGRLL